MRPPAGSTPVISKEAGKIVSGNQHDAKTEKVAVYLPPDYDANEERRYPTIYMQDGQNLFDDATSYVGEWGVDETRILPFADTVGGRYSLWSSIGFPAAIAANMA